MGTNKSKKQKRLEKYIDKKLKKERRAELYELLSKSSYTSELMKSSRSLGQNKETQREKLRRAMLEEKHGLSRSDPSVRLYVGERDPAEVPGSDKESVSIGVKRKGEAMGQLQKQTMMNEVGGNIAVNGQIKKRKRQKKNRVLEKLGLTSANEVEVSGADITEREATAEAGEQQEQRSQVDDESEFDSSDSAYDSSESSDSYDDTSVGAPSDGKEHNISSQNNSGADGEKAVLGEQVSAKLGPIAEPKKPRDQMKSVLLTPGQKAVVSDEGERKKKFYITVDRPEEIQAQRLGLPIVGEEQRIMEAIASHPVIVLCGETGSGKTTQVPQFLYEAGYGHPNSRHPGMVGITQPRRVAAVSMAHRVCKELNLPPLPDEHQMSRGRFESEVSYQIRYDASTVSDKTRIKFMTDGVLLREVAQDFLLSKYSVIIVDEAHERSLNTDILLGVLSRIVRLRQEMAGEGNVGELKLIIMSATLRVNDFVSNQKLFSEPPPVIKVDARQYPVFIHYNRKTKEDYVGEVVRKVEKIHQRLPPGGILVFLSGQAEINWVCKILRKKWGKSRTEDAGTSGGGHTAVWSRNSNGMNASEGMVEAEDVEFGDDKDSDDFRAEDDYLSDSEDSEEERIEKLNQDNVHEEGGPLRPQTGEGENQQHQQAAVTGDSKVPPLHVLPLYSLLPTDQQMRVFAPPPSGSRVCIVATNVAETSLTIPGIKYVVDAGRAKARHFNPHTGVQSYEVEWVSRASADQRAGRAGRTGPGHCYRLYSSPMYYDHFEPFGEPEIRRMPIEGVVLQMKSMNLDQVVNFPFPSAPDSGALRRAEKILTWLGALDEKAKITDLGRLMSVFPIAPRFSKMLIVGQQHGCLPYIIAIVATLTVGDPFVREYHQQSFTEDDYEDDEAKSLEAENLTNERIIEKEKRKALRARFLKSQAMLMGTDPSSDCLRLLSAVGAYEFGGGSNEFCQQHFLRPKAMVETRKLRSQLTHLVQVNCPGVDISLDPQMQPPTSKQRLVLRQAILAGFLDQVAIRVDIAGPSCGISAAAFEELAQHHKSGGDRKRQPAAYVTMWSGEPVFISPESVVHPAQSSRIKVGGERGGMVWPDLVVYTELQQTSRLYMKGVTQISPKWLVSIARDMCEFGKPRVSPLPKYNKERTQMECWVDVTFGPKRWTLPPVRAVQERTGTRWSIIKIL